MVIPILQKDLLILPLCLSGIYNCITNIIQGIYIVSPNDKKIIDFCKENNLVFVDESTLFDFTPKDINLIIKGREQDRSGWLFQQLIKLSGEIGTCDNYLCIDADHILIRPHVFITDKEMPVFYKSAEYHKPYNDNLQKLIGVKKFSFLSYVVHKMCFNRAKIKELHNLLERNANGKSWVQVIIDNYDRTQWSGFSEFQLYGHFIKNKTERSWKSHSLRYEKLGTYEELRKRYSKWYASVTFPSYKN